MNNIKKKLQKYKWKNRLLIITTSSYKQSEYIKIKDIYNKYIKIFHKRYIKLLTIKSKSNNVNIYLLGFNGKVMKQYKKIDYKSIIKLCDKYKISYLKKIYSKLNPKNLSLYSNYNFKKYIKNLGYKNKEKALYTINTIKNKSIKYQLNVINTMIGRANNHVNKTTDMRIAIKIFTKRKKKILNII